VETPERMTRAEAAVEGRWLPRAKSTNFPNIAPTKIPGPGGIWLLNLSICVWATCPSSASSVPPQHLPPNIMLALPSQRWYRGCGSPNRYRRRPGLASGWCLMPGWTWGLMAVLTTMAEMLPLGSGESCDRLDCEPLGSMSWMAPRRCFPPSKPGHLRAYKSRRCSSICFVHLPRHCQSYGPGIIPRSREAEPAAQAQTATTR